MVEDLYRRWWGGIDESVALLYKAFFLVQSRAHRIHLGTALMNQCHSGIGNCREHTQMPKHGGCHVSLDIKSGAHHSGWLCESRSGCNLRCCSLFSSILLVALVCTISMDYQAYLYVKGFLPQKGHICGILASTGEIKSKERELQNKQALAVWRCSPAGGHFIGYCCPVKGNQSITVGFS